MSQPTDKDTKEPDTHPDVSGIEPNAEPKLSATSPANSPPEEIVKRADSYMKMLCENADEWKLRARMFLGRHGVLMFVTLAGGCMHSTPPPQNIVWNDTPAQQCRPNDVVCLRQATQIESQRRAAEARERARQQQMTSATRSGLNTLCSRMTGDYSLCSSGTQFGSVFLGGP